MLKIQNLTKIYENRTVLSNINLDFAKKGLTFIHGPSGCGKTTLFNSIAGLIDFKGDIKFHNLSLKNMSEEEKSEHRIRNIGFVFQDYKLFEKTTIKNNLNFALSSVFELDEKSRKTKIENVLSLVGLSGREKSFIDSLSGGEKQRVAIARAIINSPAIILCDEPTGSLDETNSKMIMDILLSLSKTFLVIVISHDLALMSQYAERIIKLENGIVKSDKKTEEQNSSSKIKLAKSAVFKKRTQMPFSFSLNYAFAIMRKTKFRTLLNNIFLSFALLGIGVSFLAQGIIEKLIKDSYGSLVNEGSLYAETNDLSSKLNFKATTLEEVEKIALENSEIVFDSGICYQANFENFFKDKNSFFISQNSEKILLPSFSIRNINDFEWLEFCTKPIFPRLIEELEDDEMILQLKQGDIEYICQFLKIEETAQILGEYLDKHSVNICCETKNDDWQYEDEHIFTLKGFVVGQESRIFHSNHYWNQYIYEEEMRLPFSYLLDENSLPWTMKKIAYLKINNRIEEAVRKLRYDHKNSRKIFEIANSNYYPLLEEKEIAKEAPKLLVFDINISTIDLSHVALMKEELKNEQLTFGSFGGYLLFPNAFLEGFAKQIFFSSSERQIEKIVDAYTFVEMGNQDFIDLPDGVLSGHYSKSLQGGVIFSPTKISLSYGRTAQTINEIVISKKMAMSIFGYENCVGKILHLTSAQSERRHGEKMERIFSSCELVISGISSETKKDVIYHDADWSFLFFQCKLNVSAFELVINSLVFNFSNREEAQKAKRFLDENFPEYKYVYPYDELAESTKEASKFVRIITISLSIVSFLISFMLIATLDYLFVLENKKAIGLARCLGTNAKESNKLLHTYSFSLIGFSWGSATLSLFFALPYIGFQNSNILNTIVAIIVMGATSFILGGLPSFIVMKRFGKMNVLDLLKNE
ncbi:MAG: ATP-binding cassette domain-containing protein [Bacilli bacterium]|nr:ATP-binding cassette domain-containing protein [Bacilli bacterium]